MRPAHGNRRHPGPRRLSRCRAESGRTQVEPVVRRTLYPGDIEAIVDLHDRVHGAEYHTNEAFADGVAAALNQARERGWPEQGGGV